ncbi:hypothetical protein [Methylacidiphilum caldifontis]|uniref:Uncharacterized protein n=1 Tax=Methylacidiphilum caldifontis TaxID=2795386 RepID=A0A4Y8PCD1_9BACT|nr:hypothetical protein [Methylacidiphilum caldifontis]TFE68584.1 hypothetical protein A7Q10_08015 [Methylacidiphilum caldifontis]
MTNQDMISHLEKECPQGLTGTVLFYFFALSLVSFLGWGALNAFLEGLGRPEDGLIALLWLGVFLVVALFFSKQLRCLVAEKTD